MCRSRSLNSKGQYVYELLRLPMLINRIFWCHSPLRGTSFSSKIRLQQQLSVLHIVYEVIDGPEVLQKCQFGVDQILFVVGVAPGQLLRRYRYTFAGLVMENHIFV